MGVIYAALVVIAVWEEYGAAEIFWLADRLPEPRGSRVQEIVRPYAEEVVHKEWPP